MQCRFMTGQKFSTVHFTIFLSEDHYVNIPLEWTYLRAWDELPEPWREIVEQSKPGNQ